MEATVKVSNDSNWSLVESIEYKSNRLIHGNFIEQKYVNELGQYLFSHIKKDEYSTVVKNTYFRVDGIYDHSETKIYDSITRELMFHTTDGLGREYSDKTYSHTSAGSDNLLIDQNYVKLNLGKVKKDVYSGGLGGIRIEGRGIETGIELLPFVYGIIEMKHLAR